MENTEDKTQAKSIAKTENGKQTQDVAKVEEGANGEAKEKSPKDTLYNGYRISKKNQQQSMAKYGKVLANLSNDQKDLLNKISTKDLKLYAKFKEHKNKLKLAKIKYLENIRSFNVGEKILEIKKGYCGSVNIRLRRGAGELIVFTKTKDLVDYVIDITSRSPKSFRFTFVTRLQNYALDILENLFKANEVLVIRNDKVKKEQRAAFQRRALTSLNLLTYVSEMAFKHGCIIQKQFVQIIKLSGIAETLIYNWLEKDSKRFD